MHNSDDFLPEITPLLQQPYAEIGLDEEHQVIVAKWKGVLKVEEVQTGCRFMTGVIRARGIQKHLSNHSELRLLNPDVQHYLSHEWFFEVEREGLQKIAVRLANDIFAQASVRRVNTLEPYKILQIQDFATTRAAYDWLLA